MSNSNLTDDEIGIAQSYHACCTTEQLYKLKGSQAELDRLNHWRGTNWTSKILDDVLNEAIYLKEKAERQ